MTENTQKAWVAAVVGAVVGLLSTLSGALSTGDTLGSLDAQTWINALLAAIIGSGLGGGFTYAIPNRKRVTTGVPPTEPPAEG